MKGVYIGLFVCLLTAAPALASLTTGNSGNAAPASSSPQSDHPVLVEQSQGESILLPSTPPSVARIPLVVVPEASTVIAGVLLLLPFAVGVLRPLRKKKQA